MAGELLAGAPVMGFMLGGKAEGAMSARFGGCVLLCCVVSLVVSVVVVVGLVGLVVVLVVVVNVSGGELFDDGERGCLLNNGPVFCLPVLMRGVQERKRKKQVTEQAKSVRLFVFPPSSVFLSFCVSFSLSHSLPFSFPFPF